MLVSISGGTPLERRKKAKEVLATVFPKAQLQFVLVENIASQEELTAYAFQTESFFSDVQVILLKECLVQAMQLASSETLDILARSSTPFIFLDEVAGKSHVAEISGRGGKVHVVASVQEKKRTPPHNVFAICDTFSAKKKFATWAEYSKLVANNESPEAIVGILFSRVRTMLRDKRYGVYTKKEIEALSLKLALLLPKARARGEDVQLALERWILALPE